MVIVDWFAWQSHAAGMRMALKPAAFTLSISCCVTVALPHAVSPQIASIVLPRFQPIWICPATWVAGGSVCDHAASGHRTLASHSQAVRLIDARLKNRAVISFPPSGRAKLALGTARV